MTNDGLTYRDRKIYRKKMIEWLMEQGFTCHVTLTFNDGGISPDFAEAKARQFVFWTNRKLLGKRFAKRPNQQLRGAFFMEKLAGNGHVHGICLIDEGFTNSENRLMALQLTASEMWRKICPKGTARIGLLTDGEGWCRYVTKERNKFAFWSNYFFAGGSCAEPRA